DVIGVIQYEFTDWRQRPPAQAILEQLRQAMRGLPGVRIEVATPKAGPPAGKDVQVELSAADPTGLNALAGQIAARFRASGDLIDVSDGLPPPGIDWELDVDRAAAARAGVSPPVVGAMVQLVTGGLKLTDYRPPGVDDAVDIDLRLPKEDRTLSELGALRIPTADGVVPLSNFVTRKAALSTGTLTRIGGERTVTVQANVRPGLQVAAVRAEITRQMDALALESKGIRWKMAGQDEDQKEASAFLGKAAGAAVFLIFLVLLAQFNRFTSVGLVLSAVVMSTIGVFLGLIIMGQPFGIVMTGIGVIALAGVVVNNNIVLIDTYDTLRAGGMGKVEAILETCHERARPVVLTAVTAILGVLPIAFGLNLELLSHETTSGAPSTQW
ncbi:efflux RND transporter permease subunit, partial [Thioclava sp. BHET1]